MKKIGLTVCLVLLLSVSAHAKVVFVGIKGGGETWLPGIGNDYMQYNPFNDANFQNLSIEEIAEIHGIDAIAVYLHRNLTSPNNVKARIFHRDVPVNDVTSWITEHRAPNDQLFIVGYSAGGGIALRVAQKLDEQNIPVDVLGLIDKYYLMVINTISGNVRNAIVFYQEDTKPHGEDKYRFDPDKTRVFVKKVEGTSHISIDNDQRVWHEAAFLMRISIDGGIRMQEFSNGELVGWYPAGDCASASYWFTLHKKEDGGYKRGENRTMNEVCMCR